VGLQSAVPVRPPDGSRVGMTPSVGRGTETSAGLATVWVIGLERPDCPGRSGTLHHVATRDGACG